MTTLTRQEKEAVIMEEISDKTLSFGCEIILPEPNYPKIYKLVELEKIPEGNDKYGNKYILSFGYSGIIFIKELSDIQIIGHPVMIGDVLDWICNNIKYSEDNTFHFIDRKGFMLGEYITILKYWIEKRKPLSEQSIDCVDYIYSLIQQVKGTNN